MKTLAIDFGEKRVGVAISDAEGRIALPLATLSRQSDAQVIEEIARIAAEESVGDIVVGEPRRLDGSRGTAARRAASFARKLAEKTKLPVTLLDESLTSHEAEHRLRDAGLQPRSSRDKVDAVAAQILLEEALTRRRESTP